MLTVTKPETMPAPMDTTVTAADVGKVFFNAAKGRAFLVIAGPEGDLVDLLDLDTFQTAGKVPKSKRRIPAAFKECRGDLTLT